MMIGLIFRRIGVIYPKTYLHATCSTQCTGATRDITTKSSGLSGSDAIGMMTILRPEAYVFSPITGLMLTCADDLVRNLLSYPISDDVMFGLGPSSALAKELFTDTASIGIATSCQDTYPGVVSSSGTIKPTALRSLAATHLNPGQMGHIVGLAVTGADDVSVRKQLHMCGITSNRVNGEWTGVSLARYEKLVRYIREAWTASTLSPAIPLMLRYLWHKSTSRQCILDFYLSLHQHVPIFINASSMHTCSTTQNHWVHQKFTFQDLDQQSSNLALLDTIRSTHTTSSFAASMEIVAASIGSANAFKPTVRQRHHAFRGGKKVPDCVETVLRELIDVVVWDDTTHSFDLTRLPSTAMPGLRDFYTCVVEDELDDAALSAKWFPLCQALQGCEYLTTAPDGSHYELKPNIANLMKAAGWLLMNADVGWRKACDIISVRDDLEVSEHVEVVRSMMSDDRKIREVARVKVKGSTHGIELGLEAAHNIATCTHKSTVIHDTIHLEGHIAHFKRLSHGEEASASSVATALMMPALLGGYRMIDSLSERSSSDYVVLAALSMNWQGDHLYWRPWEHSSATANMSAADADKLRHQRLAAAAKMRTLLRRANNDNNSDDRFSTLLQWLERVAPSQSRGGWWWSVFK